MGGDVVALLMPADLVDRNSNRNISVIDADQVGYAYNYANHTLGVEFPPHGNGIFTTLMGVNNPAGYTNIIYAKETAHGDDVAIYHELVHWFHRLRNNVRYDNDRINYIGINLHNIGQHYWQDVIAPAAPANIAVSSESWLLRRNGIPLLDALGKPRVDFEEMRTVYGGMVLVGNLNGDDLSENLYRTDIGLVRRIGYSPNAYYEDTQVVNRIVSGSDTFGIYDNIGAMGPPPLPIRYIGAIGVGFVYGAPANRQGIGACQVL